MTNGHGRDLLQGAAVIGGTGWVAWAVEKNGFGFRGNELFELCRPNGIPFVFFGRHEDRSRIVQECLIRVGDPVGSGNDNLIPCFKQRFRQIIQRMFGAAGYQDLRLVISNSEFSP
jgi:hypothetical protein